MTTEIRIAALQLGAQGTGIEDGQMNRGSNLNLTTTSRQEPSSAERDESHSCKKIDVRIELGLRLLRIVDGCIHLPVGRHDVLPALNEVGGQVVRQRELDNVSRRWLRDPQATVPCHATHPAGSAPW